VSHQLACNLLKREPFTRGITLFACEIELFACAIERLEIGFRQGLDVGGRRAYRHDVGFLSFDRVGFSARARRVIGATGSLLYQLIFTRTAPIRS
jgi:hypothetical protein